MISISFPNRIISKSSYWGRRNPTDHQCVQVTEMVIQVLHLYRLIIVPIFCVELPQQLSLIAYRTKLSVTTRTRLSHPGISGGSSASACITARYPN